MPYDVDALFRGIENCRKSIQIFEDAIRKEKSTIRQYEDLIKKLSKGEKDGD